jgi:hypothetical protein
VRTHARRRRHQTSKEEDIITRTLATRSFTAVLIGVCLIGCGNAGDGSQSGSVASRVRSAPAGKPAVASYKRGEQAVAPALAACKRAVTTTASISATAKQEIGELCDRMNVVIEDNEATVRAVCQELASAISSPSAAARKRVFSGCYAEYAKTIK